MNLKTPLIFLLTGASHLAIAQVIAPYAPHPSAGHPKSTDSLQTPTLTLNISSHAGGAINGISIPTAVGATTKADIMGVQAETYGRLSQANIRDESHSRKYNPTQAGFRESLGTPCTVLRNNPGAPTALTVTRHRMSLWSGDGKYDFIQHEDVGQDGYNEKDGTYPDGKTDRDKLDETNLTENDEVASEFSFGGKYENITGSLTGLAPRVSVISYHYEFAFNYPPGVCLDQFSELYGGNTGITTSSPGTAVFDPSQINKNISTLHPAGKFKGTDKDMNNLFARFTFTWDYDNPQSHFDPQYRYFKNDRGTWSGAGSRTITSAQRVTTSGLNGSAVIVSDAGTLDGAGRTMGFYKPVTADNSNCIVGRNFATDGLAYTDNRVTSGDVFDQRNRVASHMSILGFSTSLKGMLNPNRLLNYENTGVNAYETYLQDLFIIYGESPQAVMDAMAAIDHYISLNQSKFKP